MTNRKANHAAAHLLVIRAWSFVIDSDFALSDFVILSLPPSPRVQGEGEGRLDHRRRARVERLADLGPFRLREGQSHGRGVVLCLLGVAGADEGGGDARLPD